MKIETMIIKELLMVMIPVSYFFIFFIIRKGLRFFFSKILAKWTAHGICLSIIFGMLITTLLVYLNAFFDTNASSTKNGLTSFVSRSRFFFPISFLLFLAITFLFQKAFH